VRSRGWLTAGGLCAALGCSLGGDRRGARDDAATLVTREASAPSPTESAASPRLPVLPLAPPYNLDADLQARIADVRSGSHDDIPVRVEGDVFVFAAPDRGRLFDPTVNLAHDALGAYFHDRFGTRPSQAVTVLVHSSAAAYEASCRQHLGAPCETPFGFYQTRTRTIFMNAARGISTVTHELVHPIVQTDFARAPTWFDEGIGSLFERPVLGPAGAIHGVTDWRLPRLQSALASSRDRDAVRVETLFAMSDDAFGGPGRDLHYAMARFLCQWLDANGWLWPFYRRWRDTAGPDPSGESAFTTVVGESPAQATPVWVAWVKGLRFQPAVGAIPEH
jgi:hypothetical protein